MFFRLVKELAEKNVTVKLKASDQMAWVQQMNNIRELAVEKVNYSFVFK